MKKIKECNKYTSIAHGPVPMHMAMQAWSIDKTTKVVGKVGFSGTPIEQTDVEIEPPGPKLVPVDNPDTFLEPDEDEDDED